MMKCDYQYSESMLNKIQSRECLIQLCLVRGLSFGWVVTPIIRIVLFAIRVMLSPSVLCCSPSVMLFAIRVVLFAIRVVLFIRLHPISSSCDS